MATSFTLDYWTDNGWYVGVLREVPGVCSQGKTLEELKENIRDAYTMMMEDAEIPTENFESIQMEMSVG